MVINNYLRIVVLLTIIILTVVHAAVNAIANRTIPNLEGCTIYLTHCLDEDCAHAIIQSGISHVKYEMFTRKSERDKELDIKRGVDLLCSGKVSHKYFKFLKNYYFF